MRSEQQVVRWAMAVGLCVLVGCRTRDEGVVVTSWRDLLLQLADTTLPARIDVPSAGLISSFDPSGGNDDFNHYLRPGPKGWWVIADLDGPGYLSRFWLTGLERDHKLRFYFDNERSPRIEKTVADFFLAGGAFAPPLANYENGCWYTYVPVPYARRLVVMAQEAGTKEGGWPRFFYQINYARLPMGQRVDAMPDNFSEADRAAIAAVRAAWSGGDAGRPSPDATILSRRLLLKPHQTAMLDPINGPGMIRLLKVTPDLASMASPGARDRVLRDVLLKAAWDGSTDFSVVVPVGDFFGSIWRRRRFASMFIGMQGHTLFSRFPMPFRVAAQIGFENQGDTELSVDVELGVTRLEPWSDQWGYFHSCWQRTSPASVGHPHPILRTAGEGKFVGCLLSVASADRSWWILEGDEIIRVDRDPASDWRGTGLEDYFNGGWYYFNVMAGPLSGLIYKAPFSTIQYRFHQLDAPRFSSELDMTFERGPDDASRGWMESVAYYYLRSPSSAASRLGAPRDRAPPPDPFRDITFMKQLLNQERLGDFMGASEYVDAFLEQQPDASIAHVLRVRQLGYQEMSGAIDSDAAAAGYAQVVETGTDPQAVEQAKMHLWFRLDASRGLLGAFCNARTEVFLDGQKVMEVDHPEQLAVAPVTVAPGRHVLVLRSRWSRDLPWVQACLRTHTGDIVTQDGWKWTRHPVGEMHSADYDDSAWSPANSVTKDLPEQPYERVAVNAFAGMQSRGVGYNAPQWNDKKDTVVFRTVFTLPIGPGQSPSAIPR